MDQKRFHIFAIASLAIFIAYAVVTAKFFPPKHVPKPVAQDGAAGGDKAKPGDGGKNGKAGGDDKKPGEKPADKAEDEKPAEIAAPPEPALRRVQLGTSQAGDSEHPYRMLVTLTNRGAAIERVELNDPKYRDIDDRSGYLGFLDPEDVPDDGGCKVNWVGRGTPAEAAGLNVDDVIVEISADKLAPVKIAGSAALLDTLREKTEPKQVIRLTVLRDGKSKNLNATLTRKPLEAIRPEDATEESLLLTLAQVNDNKLGEDDEELKGIRLRTANWEIDEKTLTEDRVDFTRTEPRWGLKLTKRFELVKVEEPAQAGADYHLVVTISMENLSGKPRKVAYQLDGPNGLPAEGKWYARRIERDWGPGLRDVSFRFKDRQADAFSATTIVDKKAKMPPDLGDATLSYMGVTGQYFAAMLLPKSEVLQHGLARAQPITVGTPKLDVDLKKLSNVSCRLTSRTVTLEPEGSPLTHQYWLFVGPKSRPILQKYENDGATLDDLYYYGWSVWFMSSVMSGILHVLYGVVGNYGIAIVLLVVIVRGCMFPLSRKQAANMQRMQEKMPLIKPELEKIKEKYKGNFEQMSRAQQELYKKHGVSMMPAGGCLLIFLQLPIFSGLYRSLQLDIELRDAPLLGNAVRWCSNLAAPDMLWHWENFMPDFIASSVGPSKLLAMFPIVGSILSHMLWLGPYFNLLPLLTIGLYFWQQKLFTPPATDEQQEMQQKMMKYMLVFIAISFFTVASGLSIYFIVSSLWGVCERLLLPKKPLATVPAGGETASSGNWLSTIAGGNGQKKDIRAKRKKRGKR